MSPHAIDAIAVISDIHGNLPALEATLADIEAAGISRIWCLGDTLGYGPFVNECMQIVLDQCEIVLAGNHDLAVRGDLDLALFGGSAGAGVAYASRVLNPELRHRLAPLAPWHFTPDVELYHASSNDFVWEYVRDARAARRHLQSQRHLLSLVGHSHIQLAFCQPTAGAGQISGGHVAAGDVVELVDGYSYVANPGSVGQPRDRDPRAAWAQVVPGVSITMRRVVYDIDRTCDAVLAAGLPPESADRLRLGW